jgi:hypothetical protein
LFAAHGRRSLESTRLHFAVKQGEQIWRIFVAWGIFYSGTLFLHNFKSRHNFELHTHGVIYQIRQNVVWATFLAILEALGRFFYKQTSGHPGTAVKRVTVVGQGDQMSL